MTTEDVASAHQSPTKTNRRGFKFGALSIAAAFALTGCLGPDGYVDGWWDNGDPIYAPLKSELFDEDNESTCNQAIVARDFESRARSFSETGGLVNLFLFEVINPELDPQEDLSHIENPAERNRERQRRERRQGSLETMYQWTHPHFDERFGIEEPADLAPIKQELQEHLEGLSNPTQEFVTRGDRWLETPDGLYTLSQISNVAGYIEENNIDHEFRGLAYSYLLAERGEESFLMVTDRETTDVELLGPDGILLDLDEDSELYEEFLIRVSEDLPDGAYEASITLSNDQCPRSFGTRQDRFWIYDYELLFPLSDPQFIENEAEWPDELS